MHGIPYLEFPGQDFDGRLGRCIGGPYLRSSVSSAVPLVEESRMNTSKERDPQTYSIIGAAMTVHSELGCGFLESVYHDALQVEFQSLSIPHRREHPIPIYYREQQLKATYRADFLCFDVVIVELKALKQITGRERAQVIHYLKATGLERALLLNFGEEQVTYERLVHTGNHRLS